MSTLEKPKDTIARDHSSSISIVYWVQQYVLSKWENAIKNRKKNQASKSFPGLHSHESTNAHCSDDDGCVTSTRDIGQVSSRLKSTRDVQSQKLTASFRLRLQKLTARATIWMDGTHTRIRNLTHFHQTQMPRLQPRFPSYHRQSPTQLCLMEVQILKRAKPTTHRKAHLPIYQRRTTLGHVLTLSSLSKLRCIHESPS